MGQECKTVAEEMEKLPLLSEALKKRRRFCTREAVGDAQGALHDGLFVRDVLMTDDSLRVDVEYTVVEPAHSLSVRVDLYEVSETGPVLLKQGTTAVSFGGVSQVVGDVGISREEGYGKNILAVLTGNRYTEEGIAVVNAQEYGNEVEIGVYQTGSALLDEITVDDPVSKQDPPREYIYICYNRSTLAKEVWDYFVPEDKGADFYIPLKGTAYFKDVNTWFDTVIPPDSEKDGDTKSKRKSELRIFMKDQGGGEVTYQNTAENFRKSFHAVEEKKDGKVIKRGFSWDFGTLPWVTSSPFTKSESRDMDFECKVVYKLRSDPEDENHVMTINSYRKLPADYAKVGYLRIYWGCLYIGTKITMADGSRKKIEELQIGEMVRGRKGGLRIKEIVEGREPRGVLLVETEGRRVYVSENHPMVTDQGVLLASQLLEHPGICLYTEDGDTERLEDVNRYVFQDDRVYSLVLEAKDGAPLPPEEHVFYANGLLTGDNDLQKDASEMCRLRQRQKYALGEHWRRDVEMAAKYCRLYGEENILWKEN